MQRREVQTPEVPRDGTARQRILGAAREQFLGHGFHGVTVADLAEGLGMSKKTIYAHFPGKAACHHKDHFPLNLLPACHT
jgi:AcrR family transcriptional regulator